MLQMAVIKSLISQPNITKVWEDFVNKRGCGHLLFYFKKSVISFHIPPSFHLSPQGTIYFTTSIQWHTHFHQEDLSTVSHDLYLIFLFLLFVFLSPLHFCLPLSFFTNNIGTLISPWIITSRSEPLECTVRFKIMLIFLCGGKRCVWVLLQTDTFIYTWALFHQPGLINN